jgi:hypothetical protein
MNTIRNIYMYEYNHFGVLFFFMNFPDLLAVVAARCMGACKNDGSAKAQGPIAILISKR